ncbi:MAG: transposase [Betaproteobacteria bacterium]|nr:transposase [Betaproteobacteria bacterium]
MMKIATVGIDLAKHVFSVHGIDEHGKAVLKRTINRGKVMEIMAGIGPCLVGVEACSGAHHWARELGRLGHAAKIMAHCGPRSRCR